jgi:intein-encoded DNA endonuclease-like protein
MSGRQLVLYNTQADLLLYIQDLLGKFGIESTDLNRGKLAGTELINPLNGRIYVRKRDCFDFHIRARSLPQFEREIGFTITRKHQRLANALATRPGVLCSFWAN